MRRTGLAVVSMVLVPVLGAFALADEITLAPGASSKASRITGQVQSESPVVVRIQPTGGQAQDVPVDQIESISYSGQPGSLLLAESRARSGDLEGALDQFNKAVADAGTTKSFIAEAAQFGQARVTAELALGDDSKRDQAIGLLEAFLKGHPKSRHFGPAQETLARLALAKGDTAKAEAAAQGLATVPWAADRAAVLRARVQIKKGQPEDALKALDLLIANSTNGATASIEVRLARAETLAVLGKFAEAEAAAKQVIEDTPAERADIQALANNTLGDCYRAAGKVKDALFAYLKTDVLFDDDKEQHARALYEIAQLWRRLNQADRADDAMARLRQQYPQSPYLK